MAKRAYVTRLSPEERQERARKAARASVEKRREDIRKRNKGMVLAYLYYKGTDLTLMEALEARRFFLEHGACGKPPEGIGIIDFFVLATGLTKRRIQQILSKGYKKTIISR